MSKADDSDDLRDEDDFSKGARGKYARRFAEGANVVVLDPDVAKRFKTSEEVSEALRKIHRPEGPRRCPEELARTAVADLLGQADEDFNAAAERVMRKNAGLCRRLA